MDLISTYRKSMLEELHKIAQKHSGVKMQLRMKTEINCDPVK